MEKETQTYRAHCLVLAFPSQGHINPMFEFSKRLEHKRVKVTLVTTYFVSKTIHKEACSMLWRPSPMATMKAEDSKQRASRSIWSAFGKSGHKLLRAYRETF
ncbi:UDP-glycosyltransferase 74B1 [Morella rubra]|uniref:UDP-glycosyltransferase 74B1 n=1 Tax=Morella rubra TaxID=262757 RepID=A0A6A1WI68_9ROSI|nr:UDP-glycosyltransferase 74B1 [Morella rubra]